METSDPQVAKKTTKEKRISPNRLSEQIKNSFDLPLNENFSDRKLQYREINSAPKINPASSQAEKIGVTNTATNLFRLEAKLNASNHVDKILDYSLVDPSERETIFRIQQKIQEAVKNKKIFLIRGDIPYLEESMRKRGWVQKYESSRTRHVPYGSVVSLDAPSLGDIRLRDGSFNEKYITFETLKDVPPDFIWDCRNDFIDWGGHIKPDAFLNRFQRSFVYTSKLGLASILQNAHWYNEENISSVQFPRSYNVVRDKCAFIKDYRRTAATSLLKFLVDQMDQGVNLSTRGHSRIPLKQVEFAIERCEEFVAAENDENLDVEESPVDSDKWDSFVDDYLKVIHEGYGIADNPDNDFDSSPSLSSLYTVANETLKKVKSVDPQYELNGIRNIWILKPSDLCCGTGIIMSHKLVNINKRVQDCPKDYFIVQKYIERPFLVHGTKFDVRQWFLVTKSYPLTIWIYKESFLRFSSRPFTFDTYHETIHLCNTAIQNKYIQPKNSIRSQDWDCDMLNSYLKSVGHKGEPWYDLIYPKMCQAVVATMLAAQEHVERRKFSFELFGADFMIADDLSVWLIEINTNPRMHPPSTRVTLRLYPDVLESLLKVVMDLPANPNTNTGNFVLAYEQTITDFQPYLGSCMFALGKSIKQRSNTLINPNGSDDQ
ncbi:tubulin glycylase 3A-like [Prorops nasuta]|uniref:tubulin glycylase 3A-like n=1 Tax=Prorops nasuta TaxID=863751 RepID=UPI0034D01B50